MISGKVAGKLFATYKAIWDSLYQDASTTRQKLQAIQKTALCIATGCTLDTNIQQFLALNKK